MPRSIAPLTHKWELVPEMEINTSYDAKIRTKVFQTSPFFWLLVRFLPILCDTGLPGIYIHTIYTATTRYARSQYAKSLAVLYEIIWDFNFITAKLICYPVWNPSNLDNPAYRFDCIFCGSVPEPGFSLMYGAPEYCWQLKLGILATLLTFFFFFF